MEKITLKHALLNAVQYDGKADVKAVLGKVLAERPEFRDDVESVRRKVEEVVGYVNSMSPEEQRKKLGEMGIAEIAEGAAGKKIKKETGVIQLPPLPGTTAGSIACNVEHDVEDHIEGNIKRNIVSNIVLRMAPYPSGPLHIGNARMVVLNDEYAKRYGGKLLLIYDDTIGSEEKTILPDGYKLIKEGLDWLGVRADRTFYKSDRMKIYYKYGEALVKGGEAYVCLCSAGVLRKNRVAGKECRHRTQPPGENLGKWKGMLGGRCKPGAATLRLKTDMKHPNPAFRDRVLFRISDRRHPRAGKKYKVWPMLEFSWAIDDHLLGVTHVIRGKELTIEDEMEESIWERLGWKGPRFVHYGLLNLEGVKLSKSRARIAIEKKELRGWDDPRTWSLQALRRRGIQPEAVRRFAVKMGLSLADVSVPVEILYAENRKLIDPVANRYHAVLNPVKISIKTKNKIKNKLPKFARIPLHPDFKKRGARKIPVSLNEIYIEKEDLKKHCGEDIGLIGLFSVKLGKTGKKSEFLSSEIRFESPKIQWVSKKHAKIKIIMPDGSEKMGICEPSLVKAKAGDLVQLVRIGFCRVDRPGKETVLYFTHK